MRARMSDAYGRASFLCAFVPPQSFPCAENDRAIGAATADKALDEARAILAETERGCVPDWPSKFPEDRTIFCLANEAADALADSLRAFCEGTDGYGYTTYDCLTCGVSAGPMNGLEACAERASGHDVRARFIAEGH